MIIVSLKKKNSDVIIVFDDGTYAVIDYRTVVDFMICKGDSIDEARLDEIKKASSYLKARDSSYRLISRRMHSRYELKTKLRKKKFSEELIDKVLDELAEKRLLNEEEFVDAFVKERIHRKKIGISKLKSELMRRGIRKEMLDSLSGKVNQEEYQTNIENIASKKIAQIRRKETDGRKIRAKLFSFLMQKGYETDLIIQVISKLAPDSED